MESERLLVAAGLTAAAVVGAFIFWGPSTTPHSGRGRLAGLINAGKTCFLNAILHALAACPHFIQWLDKESNVEETSLRATLSTVLSVVNGTNKSVQDTYAPCAVIEALKRLGWVIPPGEQDAHELLNVILTTLDEETQKKVKTIGCLSDALATEDDELDNDNSEKESSRCESPEMFERGSVMSLNDLSSHPMSLSWRGSRLNLRYRWISRSLTSIHVPAPLSQPETHPFNGTLATQLCCTVCNRKSAARYDKFECLSLNLPMIKGDEYRHTLRLRELLANFVAPEEIRGVECTPCANFNPNANTPHIKSLYFGKLPNCLCIHLSRNTWTATGIIKRQDYVQFPMRLSMAPYTFVQAQCQQKTNFGKSYMTSTSEGGSPVCFSMPTLWGDLAAENQNIYQLAAVIVHMGDAYSGHFITYRRGYQNSKWYYTSDTEIREVSIDEVLKSRAYMLFYEKNTTP